MWLSKEKRFLYTRIAILLTTAGWIGAALAGLKGYPLWYGGFVLCFWVSFGLLNYHARSSFWLALKRPALFAVLFSSLACVLLLMDMFGLSTHIWFYPIYKGWGLLFVWLVIYPFGGLSVLELFHFLARCLGETLHLKERSTQKWQMYFDILEHILFLLMIAVIILGATWISGQIVVLLAASIAVLWILAALIKMRFHINDLGQYLLIIILAVMHGVLSHWLPHTIAREWVGLDASFLNLFALGLPLWVWIGSFLFTLVPLRLWMFLALYSEVK